MDFTRKLYVQLVSQLKDCGYGFITYSDYCAGAVPQRFVILRHDVDLKPQNSLEIARLEKELETKATYYFRAVSESWDKNIIKSIFRADNPWILIDGSLYRCGLDISNFLLMLAGIGILLFADLCRRRNIVVRDVILRQDGWFRWLFIALAVTAILTFGIWGPNYDAAGFIYFQF